MIVGKRLTVFFCALHNPCPNILVLDILELLDAMALPILAKLASLDLETINQVRAADNISRFAFSQMDPSAALGGTTANLPHFLSSQDLVKPKLFDDKRHLCLPSQATAFATRAASTHLVFDRTTLAIAPACSAQAQVSRIRARVFATKCYTFGMTFSRHE